MGVDLQTTAEQPQILSVDEASAAYPGQWILMRVTACDQDDVPSQGVVVATGRTRSSIQPAVMQAVTSAKEIGAQYYVLFCARSGSIT